MNDKLPSTAPASGDTVDPLVLHFLDIDRLEDAKRRLHRADDALRASIEQLRHDRRHGMRAGPFSVRDKTIIAPSGDPHDFVSIPTYFWPNPDTPDGLPWVFIDGKKNPQLNDLDSTRLFKLMNAIEVLALCAWYFDDGAAAERAAVLLRTWFLDPETRMNPHLTYAQLEPGNPRGYSLGIIDFQRGYLLLDLLHLLRRCNDAITLDDLRGIRQWFEELLDWIVTSDLGHEECARLGNHGTWYDAQVVAYRLYLGDPEGASDWLRTKTLPRMAKQISPEGDQPRESQRVPSLQYCVFNLFGLCVLAELGRSAGEDIWTHSSEDGRSIKLALDWLVPYLTGDRTLDGPITKHHGTFSVSAEATMTLRLAAERLEDERYSEALDRLVFKKPACRSDVLLPPRNVADE
jgi:hypothetical protein